MCVFQCLISSPGGLHLFVNYVLVGGGAFQVQTAVLWPDAEAVCSHPDRFHTWTLAINSQKYFFFMCVVYPWICQILSFFFFLLLFKFHAQDGDVQHSIQSDRRCLLLFCFVHLGLLCSVSWYHPCMVSTVDWMLKIK